MCVFCFTEWGGADGKPVPFLRRVQPKAQSSVTTHGKKAWGCPGGPAAENPRAKESARVPPSAWEGPTCSEQLSPCTTTTEARVLRTPALQREKPQQREAGAPQLERSLCPATKTQHSWKEINKSVKKIQKEDAIPISITNIAAK